MSCFNLSQVLIAKDQRSTEAGQWLRRARELLEDSLRKEDNPQRRKELATIQEEFVRYFGQRK